MTVLAKPSALTEYNQPDHNACGYIAESAVLDALELPTLWTNMKSAGGGDAQGTFGSQLVTAAHSRDASVVAFTTVDDPHVIVAKWIPKGYYVLLSGYCDSNAEPAAQGSPISHWFIVYGTDWECCNIWRGTYPTYPKLAASYVARLGCVIIGRSASVVVNPSPVPAKGDIELPLFLYYVKDTQNPTINAGFIGNGLHCRWIRDQTQLADIIAHYAPTPVGDANDPVADPGFGGSPVDLESAQILGVPFGAPAAAAPAAATTTHDHGIAASTTGPGG